MGRHVGPRITARRLGDSDGGGRCRRWARGATREPEKRAHRSWCADRSRRGSVSLLCSETSRPISGSKTDQTDLWIKDQSDRSLDRSAVRSLDRTGPLPASPCKAVASSDRAAPVSSHPVVSDKREQEQCGIGAAAATGRGRGVGRVAAPLVLFAAVRHPAAAVRNAEAALSPIPFQSRAARPCKLERADRSPLNLSHLLTAVGLISTRRVGPVARGLRQRGGAGGQRPAHRSPFTSHKSRPSAGRVRSSAARRLTVNE